MSFQTSDSFVEFIEMQNDNDSSVQRSISELSIAGAAYDTVWALALGLNKTIDKIQSMSDDKECSHMPGIVVPLEQFDYHNDKMGCLLRRSIAQVSFTGVTVRETKLRKFTSIAYHFIYKTTGNGLSQWQ